MPKFDLAVRAGNDLAMTASATRPRLRPALQTLFGYIGKWTAVTHAVRANSRDQEWVFIYDKDKPRRLRACQ